MEFLNGLFNYSIVFVAIVAVVVGAVYLGKVLRDKKDAKEK